MILLVVLVLLFGLSAARRALDPACPACSAKSWAPHSTQLHCERCGWSTPPRVGVAERARPGLGLPG